MSEKQIMYDVCIIGAGPAALACLSAIQEPFSVNMLTEHQLQRALGSMQLHRQRSVCVMDPSPGWMHEWKNNFSQLCIDHLRSPAMAHPDMFDTDALLAYARHRQQENELFESGCADIKKLVGLGETQVGFWKLPSSKLFAEFCDDLTNKLPHTRLRGHAIDVDTLLHTTNTREKGYRITYCDVSTSSEHFIHARHVILATGMVGKPVVPPGLVGCPALSWKHPHAFSTTSRKAKSKSERILVVGGGLTAVQAALRVLQDGHECVLCSQRPLQEKHFDIDVAWFDRRNTNQRLSHLYHDDPNSRLKQLREARDGGSVPPMYLKRLDKYHNNDLTRWVGQVEYVAGEDQHSQTSEGDTKNNHNTHPITIRFQDQIHCFDRVILACGVAADCTVHPVMSKLLAKWPIPIHGGFPLVTQDLQWSDKHNGVFVVGAMAALQVGPDAGNLMGIRRAAMVIANALECRCWLRSQVLKNPFEALSLDDDDDTDTDIGEESMDDCSTCGEES